MERRRVLKLLGAGLAGVGGAKAIDNSLLGYGEFGNGENLLSQDLTPLVAERLPTERIPREYRFEFLSVEEFFTTLETQHVLPAFVGAMRGDGFEDVSLEDVEAFTGATPTDTEATLRGLIEAFRDHSYYDVPRYLAGSVQDNVLFGVVDLREPFRDDVSIPALLNAERQRGMFCYEYTWQAIAALHTVAPADQSPPVFGGWVVDDRHKHVYNAIGSAYLAEDDSIVFPITFVDYTHTTLYDDVALTSVLGSGFDAYNSRHRATSVYWDL